MRSLVFEGDTWLIYEELRQNDAKQHRVLCRLFKELLRGEPTQGTGKPERLKHQLSGLWSRRISKKDRLIYSFDDKYIYIFAIGGHYER
jgi:toxin YoeB